MPSIRIGKPIHYKPVSIGDRSTCGITVPEYYHYDIKFVDCWRCQKTTLFKEEWAQRKKKKKRGKSLPQQS